MYIFHLIINVIFITICDLPLKMSCALFSLKIQKKSSHHYSGTSTGSWKRRGCLKSNTETLNFVFSYLSTQTGNHHMSKKFSCKHWTPGAEKMWNNSQSETCSNRKKCKRFSEVGINILSVSDNKLIKEQSPESSSPICHLHALLFPDREEF